MVYTSKVIKPYESKKNKFFIYSRRNLKDPQAIFNFYNGAVIDFILEEMFLT